jgi:phage baseplate assembly protein W
MAGYIFRNNLDGNKRPSTGVGISLPFDGYTGINSTYSTQAATKSNLLNFLLTDNRERIFNPNFGSGIRSLIFEQITTSTAGSLETMVVQEIKTYFPNIIIDKFNVTPIEDLNTLQIYFRYSIALTNIQDEIQVTFQNNTLTSPNAIQ